MKTLDPEGAVTVGVKDAWEAMMLMLKGLENLAIHREDQRFGR